MGATFVTSFDEVPVNTPELDSCENSLELELWMSFGWSLLLELFSKEFGFVQDSFSLQLAQKAAAQLKTIFFQCLRIFILDSSLQVFGSIHSSSKRIRVVRN